MNKHNTRFIILKYIAIAAVGSALTIGTFLLFMLWQSIRDVGPEANYIIWLTGAPFVVISLLVLGIASIVVFVALLAHFYFSHEIADRQSAIKASKTAKKRRVN